MTVVPSLLAKTIASGVAGTLMAARVSGTTIDAIAEFLLGRADLRQECDRIERAMLLAQRSALLGHCDDPTQLRGVPLRPQVRKSAAVVATSG
ncbi:MAG TPA: hypothetical protein VF014_09835 [Casimicrobiaceae bacterium]|nr:hypothetical protein [Casimicrobiaceae bacterium]